MAHDIGSAAPPRSGAELSPRPEALPLEWDELLETTQRATGELIRWLCSAARALDAKDAHRTRESDGHRETNEQLATSVLVAGDRGFGKTTVLLSAAEAFSKPDSFIPESVARESREARELRSLLKDFRRQMVWLEPLDMEPLPTDANLLATLLVRVRDALNPDLAGNKSQKMFPAVLPEEGAEDPWAKIDTLVRDATFMWEDKPVQGQDARQRAEYQLKAAEIYSTFRSRLFEAIDLVSRYLARRRGQDDSEEGGVILILPIDNVDRSIQHLHLILKLTRMVASRRLWFVLASGRQEFQLFLERTFQAELTEFGKAVSDSKGADETRSIARRQAAAAMRRVLPQVHRIEIKQLTPDDVWKFYAPASLAGEASEQEPLSTFLKALRLSAEPSRAQGLTSFADLFDVQERLDCKLDGGLLLRQFRDVLRKEEDEEEDGRAAGERRQPRAFIDVQEHRRVEANRGSLRVEGSIEMTTGQAGPEQLKRSEERPVFTYAARLALSMSARTALDLWQEARSAYHQQQAGETLATSRKQAIGIAHRMLLMAIDESELPSWASEQLLHRIIRKDPKERVSLDLTGEPVRRLKLSTLSDALEWHGPPAKACGPEPVKEVVLRSELHLRYFKDVILELHDLEAPERSVPMPAPVAGWFMLLHDLLVISEQSLVLNRKVVPLDVTPELVVTRHEAVLASTLVELDFRWLLPQWDTFFDSFIFTMQWRAFSQRLEERLHDPKAASVTEEHALFRLILAAWVDNVCAVAGDTRGGWCWKALEQIDTFEDSVVARVRALESGSPLRRIRYGRHRIARDWLEFFLPLMLKPEFMPGNSAQRLREQLYPRKNPPKGDKNQEDKNQEETNQKALEARREKLVSERRKEMVRAVVKRSGRYSLLQETHAPGAAELRAWLDSACGSWFGAWDT